MSSYDQLERLQRKCDDLRQLYEIASRKKSSLRRQYTLETHPVSKLQWEQGIADANYEVEGIEAELNAVEYQIERLKKDLGGEPLYSSLLRLNYREQARVFKQFFEDNNQVGGFLIHGKEDHGQRW